MKHLLLSICFFLGMLTLVHARTPIRIAVSLQPQIEFVKAVGQERVEVQALIPAGSPHEYYEPSVRLIQFLSSAQFYIKNGHLPFEGAQLKRLLSLNRTLKVIEGNPNVSWLHYPSLDPLDTTAIDPHIWMSPKMVVAQVHLICDLLCKLDPDYRPFYQLNRDQYCDKLAKLDQKIHRLFSKTSSKKFLTLHPSFGYFCQEYGLEQVCVDEEGKSPTPHHIRRILDLSKQSNIHVVVVEKSMGKDAAKALTSATNGVILTCDPMSNTYIASLLSFSVQLSRHLK